MSQYWGSPPRVRSRLVGVIITSAIGRITSACAEQTPAVRRSTRIAWDHLRVCGADYCENRMACCRQGSPPRVRSRLVKITRHQNRVRITSACAEQTAVMGGACALVGDHLRVCGADMDLGDGERVYEGSPPRVRSRPVVIHHQYRSFGITSACAEQTTRPPWGRSVVWDHLRVCGADDKLNRIQSGRGDHLRVCGADFKTMCESVETAGSPPRVRSRLHLQKRRLGMFGITSACAEQTP